MFGTFGIIFKKERGEMILKEEETRNILSANKGKVGCSGMVECRWLFSAMVLKGWS